MSGRKVAILAAMDTKGEEAAYLRDILCRHGLTPLTIDIGVLAEPPFRPDYPAEKVAEAAGAELGRLRQRRDQAEAMRAMAKGLAAIVGHLFVREGLAGVIGFGGGVGTSVVSAAMRTIPLGVPKVLVSTVVSGDIAPYVDISDICVVPAVTDIAGLNFLSRRILANAANALAGMVAAWRPLAADKPVICATMFGVVTRCVMTAKRRLEESGYDVPVFHAVGKGGRAMEEMIRSGAAKGVLDITTTELCDELLGGVFSAGPGRLRAAAETGVPQVVSVGAMDMVNFGPRATVPEAFAARLFHEHTPSITLMRTSAEECSALGRVLAERIRPAKAACAVFLPEGGLSALDCPGGAFYDPAADAALFAGIEKNLDNSRIAVSRHGFHINDAGFALAMVEKLLALLD